MNISSSPEEENKNVANYWRQSGAPQSRGEQEAQEGGRRRRRWRCREKPMKRRRRKRTSGRGGRTENFTEALQRSAGVCEWRKTQRTRIPERLLHGGVRGPGGGEAVDASLVSNYSEPLPHFQHKVCTLEETKAAAKDQ